MNIRAVNTQLHIHILIQIQIVLTGSLPVAYPVPLKLASSLEDAITTVPTTVFNKAIIIIF